MNRFRYMRFDDTDDKIKVPLQTPDTDPHLRMKAIPPGTESARAGYTTLDQASEYQVERSGLSRDADDVWPRRT